MAAAITKGYRSYIRLAIGNFVKGHGFHTWTRLPQHGHNNTECRRMPTAHRLQCCRRANSDRSPAAKYAHARARARAYSPVGSLGFSVITGWNSMGNEKRSGLSGSHDDSTSDTKPCSAADHFGGLAITDVTRNAMTACGGWIFVITAPCLIHDQL